MKRNELLSCISLNLLFASLLLGAIQVGTVEASPPYLQYVVEYNYSPIISNNPYGRVNVITTICKLMNDGTSSYDWYFYSNTAVGNQGIRLQTVPGTVSYGSDWETSFTYATHTVPYAGTYRWLVDYDPTTTDGYDTSSKTAGVSVSPEGGGISFSQTYYYSIPYIKVIDYSDFSTNKAMWLHDFHEQGDPVGAPSDSTYLARPAFVVKTVQDYWSYVNAIYKVQWAHPVWWWWEYQEFQTGYYYLDALKTGDS